MWVVQQLTKPVCDHIRKKYNVVITVYIDDFILIFHYTDLEESTKIFLQVVDELEKFGFKVFNITKTLGIIP